MAECPLLAHSGHRLVAPHMSAFGVKRTSLVALRMSAIGGKADMAIALHMSAFDPKRTSGSALLDHLVRPEKNALRTNVRPHPP